MLDVILDAAVDSVKLVPFLFLAYLAMEYWEHRAGEGSRKLILRAGQEDRFHAGPVLGGLLGAVPQCGFSAAASNLYAGHVITLGTLMAVYLSTSDEMLPVLISERAPAGTIFAILGIKAVIGMGAGILIDCTLKKRNRAPVCIHDICEKENCHCEKGIFRSAVFHTLHIAFFILVVTLLLNLMLYGIGEDALADLILNRPVAGPLLAAVVGLIPNCAGSVVITQLYLQGAMGFGAALAGLLTGSGVGVLVLFRTNRDRKENVRILALLYAVGAIVGVGAEAVLSFF